MWHQNVALFGVAAAGARTQSSAMNDEVTLGEHYDTNYLLYFVKAMRNVKDMFTQTI